MPFGHVVKAHEDIVPARDKWKLVRKKVRDNGTYEYDWVKKIMPHRTERRILSHDVLPLKLVQQYALTNDRNRPLV
jgi:hypothetical protein